VRVADAQDDARQQRRATREPSRTPILTWSSVALPAPKASSPISSDTDEADAAEQGQPEHVPPGQALGQLRAG
jgi:hypothetical protein